MIKKILQGSVVLAVFFAWTAIASAAALNWDSDTTIDLSSPDIDLIIKSGSVATTLQVDAGDIIVQIPASSTFTVTSASRGLTTSGQVDATVSNTCSSGVATLALTTLATARTITITPTGAQCTTPSSGGGGGGPLPVGPSPSPNPAPNPNPNPEPTQLGAHPNGALILDDSTVYLIENNSRMGFRNEPEYLSYGYEFSQVVPSTSADNALPYITIKKAMEGTLVLDSSDNRTVYMIGVNATKRGFTSSAVFTGLGYNFSNLPKINLSDYPSGNPVGDVYAPHPDGALVLDGKTIWWIRNNQKTGFESMTVFDTYGFSLSRVVTANAADKALSVGSAVKFRDGTLVLDGGTYFVISDGQKRPFPTMAVFTGLGYKASSAVKASLSGYVQGPAIN